MDAITTAAVGMYQAAQQVDKLAKGVAQGTADPVQSAVGQVSAETAFKADAEVMKVAEKMTGALLDILA